MTMLIKTGKCKFSLITDDVETAKRAKKCGGICIDDATRCGVGVQGGTKMSRKLNFTFFSPTAASEFLQYAKNGAETALESFKMTKEYSSSLFPVSSILGPFPRKKYLPYQQSGIEFMVAHKRVLLADPPGLGKTIQIAGVLNQLKIKNVLIICPASLRLNWEQELSSWLSYKPDTLEIISVDSVWRKGVFSKLANTSFDFMAVDEAHYIKEKTSKRSMACAAIALKTPRVVLMTGTPIKNRPRDIFNLLHILDEELFPDYRRFTLRYCAAFQQTIYIAGGRKKIIWNDNGSSNEEELQDILRSTLMLRRSKEKALPQLPRKSRHIFEIEGKFKSVKEEEAAWKNVCDSIGYEEALKQMESGSGVAFSQMASVRQEVALSKVPFVIEHVSNLVENGEKVILFAYHRSVIFALNEGLKEYKPVMYIGGMNEKQKDEARKTFIEDDECKIFIGNIQAAGTGLTLTVSSTVVFAEMTYCPSEMEQCEDRACRIGQEASSVLVHHLVLSGSLDVTMCKRLLEKQRIADEILDKGSVLEKG